MTVRVADGLKWLSRGPTTDDHLGHDAHEHVFEPILRALLPDQGVFVDVGAHVGHWALRLAGQASKVYAIEANPRTFAVLEEHISLNDLQDKVVPINLAVWDHKANVDLTDPNNRNEGGSTFCTETDMGPVLGLPLDDILSGIGKIDLIKIDVEGAEVRVIRGAHQVLSRRHPALFIEVHDKIYGEHLADDLSLLLAENGYRIEVLPPYGQGNYWVAEPR